MQSVLESLSRSPRTTATKTQMFNNTSFNTLAGISKQLKQAIITEGHRLMEAPKLCEEIWNTMRKSDFDQEGEFTYKMVDFIFEKHKESFKLLLNINSTNELFPILDQDENGSLNEDEQILLFSLIKEKMNQCANHLSDLQEYSLSKDLMKSLRELEININRYQNEARQNIYNNNMKIYDEIGIDKLDEFYNRYDTEFRNFNQQGLEKISNLKQRHEDDLQKLMEKFDRASELFKFKPQKKIKELQINEKLVSIDERIEEALNLRKELKDLEITEGERLNNLRLKYIEKQRNQLLFDQKKELEQLERKLKIEENKLIIRMKREFDILNKKIHLHEHEIRKIQALAQKYAWKKGLVDGELKRTKDKARKQNALLTESKSIDTLSQFSKTAMTSSSSLNQTDFSNISRLRKTGQSMAFFAQSLTTLGSPCSFNSLKILAKSANLTRFNIRPKFANELPVNIRGSDNGQKTGDFVQKIEKFLNYEKKYDQNYLPPLTKYYDEHLQLIPPEKTATEGMSEAEKTKMKAFIGEKLMGDRKFTLQLINSPILSQEKV